jgi:hypothetical protein
MRFRPTFTVLEARDNPSSGPVEVDPATGVPLPRSPGTPANPSAPPSQGPTETDPATGAPLPPSAPPAPPSAPPAPPSPPPGGNEQFNAGPIVVD